MTTIIGIQHEWGAEIYGDGQTTGEDGRPFNDVTLRKVVKRGEFLLAAAGGGGACDFVTQSWLPPLFNGRNAYREMVESVVPHLRTSLRESLNYEMNGKDENDLSLIVAVHGVVYLIDDDGTVLVHPDGVVGIGSGSTYAVGALYAGADIGSALKIAEANDVYTGPPYIVEKQPKPGMEVPTQDVGEPSDDDSTAPADAGSEDADE